MFNGDQSIPYLVFEEQQLNIIAYLRNAVK